MSTTFEYPINIKVGDQVVINDTEEHKTYLETVTAPPEMSGSTVSIWTNKRLLHCDSGMKVSIRRKVSDV